MCVLKSEGVSERVTESAHDSAHPRESTCTRDGERIFKRLRVPVRERLGEKRKEK